MKRQQKKAFEEHDVVEIPEARRDDDIELPTKRAVRFGADNSILSSSNMEHSEKEKKMVKFADVFELDEMYPNLNRRRYTSEL